MSNFEIIIASLPDKENVVAEIYYRNKYWAQISQESGQCILKLYSDPDGQKWEFEFEEAMNILNKAKEKLIK